MTTPCLRTPIAVRMEDRIVLFSSRTVNREYIHETWTYNLQTKHWRRCPVPQRVALSDKPYMCGVTAVAIGPVIYMFGLGQRYSSNGLWQLTQTTDGSFEWNQIHMQNRKWPSPRMYHSGWAYGDKMWIFGGHGMSPDGYLDDHGDFEMQKSTRYGQNNQLFFYDPSMDIWMNTECFGQIPSPRHSASSVIIRDKVWLYGGKTSTGWQCELYQLLLNCLTWIQIHIGMPKPQICKLPFLTPFGDNQLALLDHDGSNKIHTTGILDVESYKWRQHHEVVGFYCLSRYSSTPGVNNDATILVGGYNSETCDMNLFFPMLQPKSLEQLAMRIIHQNRNDLPWKSLPPSLIKDMN